MGLLETIGLKNKGVMAYVENQKFKYLCYYFKYNNCNYPKGTEFIYNGECEADGVKVRFNNQVCRFLCLADGHRMFFETNGKVFHMEWPPQQKGIQIASTPRPIEQSEFYFTDEMVTNTIWYIIVMLAGFILNDRILLWIFATTVYVKCTFFKGN